MYEIEESENRNEHRFILTALLLIGLGLLFLAVASQNSTAAVYNWPGGHTVPPGTTENYNNDVINCGGWLLVAPTATMNLNNTTINMNPGSIIMIDGTFNMGDNDNNNTTTYDQSIIQQSVGSQNFLIVAQPNSQVTIRNSWIRNFDSIHLWNTNTKISYNTIQGSFRAFLMFQNTVATIDNNTIFNNNIVLDASNGGTTLTFTRNRVYNNNWGNSFILANGNLYTEDNVFVNNPTPQFQYLGQNDILDMNNDTFLKPSNGGTSVLIYANGAPTTVYIDDCEFSYSNNDGILIQGGSGFPVSGYINDTVFYDNNGPIRLSYTNFIMDGVNSTYNHGDNLRAQYSNLNISNSQFSHGNNNGIYFSSISTSTYVLDLENVNTDFNSWYGIFAQIVNKVQIDNSTSMNNSNHAIFLNNVYMANIHYSVMSNTTSSSGINAQYMTYLNITNSVISKNNGLGIDIFTCGNAKLLDNVISKSTSDSIRNRATSLILQKNTIQDGTFGLNAYDLTGSHYLVVDQNTIRRHTNNAIWMNNGHLILTKNTIQNSVWQQVYLQNLQSNSRIDDNDVRNGGHVGIEVRTSNVVSFSGNTVINHTNEHAVSLLTLYNELIFVKNFIDKSRNGVDYTDYSGGNFGITFNNNTISNTTNDWAVFSEFTSYNGDASFQDNTIINNVNGLRFDHHGSLKSMFVRRNTIRNITNDWAFIWYNDGYTAGYLDIYKNKLDGLNGGFNIQQVGQLDIRKNTVTGVHWTAIYVPNAGGALNITDNEGYENDGATIVYTYLNNNYYQYPANVQRNYIHDDSDTWALEFYGWGKILFEDNVFSEIYAGADFDGYSLIARNNRYINNSDSGVYAYSFQGDVHIYNETAIGNQYGGWYLDETHGAKIRIDNSTFMNNGYYGLYVEDIYGGSLEIQDCVFDGAEEPVYFYWIDITVKFHDNYVANATYEGIYVDYFPSTGSVHIYDNIFFMNNEHIELYYTNAIIENNDFQRGRYGVYSYGSNHLFIFRNNTMKGIGDYNIDFEINNPKDDSGIYDNRFQNFGTGIVFYSTGDDMPVFNNIFTMGRYALDVESASPHIHDNTIKMVSTGIESYNGHSTIESNTFVNCWDYGIVLWDDKGSEITGNSFSYSTMGIYSEGSLVTVTDNTFTLNTYGTKINSSFATLSGNTYTDNKYGVYIEAFSFVTIIDGSYTHNTDFGIWSEANTYSSLEVNGATNFEENAVILNGDVTVRNGGELTITSCMFQLRSIGGTGYSIILETGSSLEARRTTFEPLSDARPFGIVANAGSSLHLYDCDLVKMGSGATTKNALYIATSDVVLEKVTIKDAVETALYIEGQVSFAMRNSTISGAQDLDVFIQNASTLRMGNTDFNKKNVEVLDTSMIIIERIISIEALDDFNLPYEAVDVTVTDDKSNTITGETDNDGMWSEFFEGAIISSTGITDTKITYKVSVTDGTLTFNDTVQLSDDFIKTYRFGIAPVVLNGPSEITMDEDVVYSLDMEKYFFDNDQMTFSAKNNVSTFFTFDGMTGSILPAKDWFGHEDVTLVATDTHNLKVEYKLSITVRPVNDIPVISGVPNLVLKEDQEFRLDLLPFIYDPDTSQSGLTVTVSSTYAKVDRTTVVFEYPTPFIEFVRISVKDAEGGTAQDILVSVMETNDSPRIKDIPLQNATEDVETTIDFAQWISDEDNPLSDMVLSSNSEYLVKVNGTKMTFLFPDGPTQRFVQLVVSDGLANNTVQVEFFVQPVNDAPVLGPLPIITVTEREDFVFDLTTYVTDIDTNISKLIITTSSASIKVEGLSLIINMPDSGSMVTVTITVSDAFLSDSGELRIIIKPVNDAPVLSNPSGPADGTVGGNYKFKVTFTDPDAEHPVVFVVIDGKKYAMTKTSGDFKTGAVYEINLKNVMKAGDYSYHFEADDGSGQPNGQARTEEKFGLDVSEQQNWWWLIIVIIIIVVVAILLLVGRSKSAPKTVQMDDEPKDDAPEDEDAGTDEEETAQEPEEVEEVEEVEEEAPKKTKKVSRR